MNYLNEFKLYISNLMVFPSEQSSLLILDSFWLEKTFNNINILI